VSAFQEYTRILHPVSVTTKYYMDKLILIFPIDPSVYPEFDLYPSVLMEMHDVPRAALTSQYPYIRICASQRDFEVIAKQIFVDPAVYPCFEIYPGHISDEADSAATGEGTSQQSVHPRFDACEYCFFTCRRSFLMSRNPEVYPYFDIYGTGSPTNVDKPTPLSVKLSVQYPAFNLCEPFISHFLYCDMTTGLQIRRFILTSRSSPVSHRHTWMWQENGI
jgi:hypothetical protein